MVFDAMFESSRGAMLLYSPLVPREGAPVPGRFQLQLLHRSTGGFRCAEVSCSSCLSTAQACATPTARVAHAGRTYRMVVVRLPCTGSQHTVNYRPHGGSDRLFGERLSCETTHATQNLGVGRYGNNQQTCQNSKIHQSSRTAKSAFFQQGPDGISR
jgi:hypothetical protein